MCKNDFGIKAIFRGLGWPLRKICVFILLTFLKVYKRSGVKQKNYGRKRWFGNFKMTFCDPWGHISYYKTCIFTMLAFIQIFINVAEKKIAKFP